MLFKFFDPALKEEKDVKKIKDDQIFAKTTTTQKIIKFTSLKQKSIKETSASHSLEVDTPVFVGPPHSQYGVIRRMIKPLDQQTSKSSTAFQYEVRLSTSLENVIVEPTDLKRSIRVAMRLHSLKGEQCQIVNVTVRIDSSVQQLLQYVASIAQCPTNFINLYHKMKRLGNSDVLYKENIEDGDRLLCL